MQFWNELEGQTIDGCYPLRRLVRSEGRSAWFETETGEPQNTPATISLTEALTDADEVVERLNTAQSLNHPNLVTITKVGQVSLDNTLVVYAVMEHIEQSLSDVLQSQPLSAEEGREVAEAMVGALTAIHQKGMSHGHVEAASVLATEQTVKLRSDCLHATQAGQVEDVAGVGATLFHAFTQRKALTATDAQINRIPAPFAEIIRNSFGRRWTLGQIANALKPAALVATATSPAAATVPAQKTIPPAPLEVKGPAKAAPVAYSPPAPAAPVEKPLPLAIEQKKPRPLALYVAIAFVVLGIAAWLFWPHPAPPAGSTTSPPIAAQTPTAAVPVKQKPPAVKPSVKPSEIPSAKPSAVLSAGHPVWRVVAYTYRRQEQAVDRVTAISKQDADLGASIFNPPGRDSVYLVTVGGAMDHNQATKMLDRARSKGLPADSYIQNFSK